jgi:hypothetical protein
MANRNWLWIVCGMALCALAVAPGARAAMNEHKTMYLTFNQPVRLPGVSLGSGTYIFEIANPGTGADVVRVLSRDRKTAYFMGFTKAAARPHALRANQIVSLGEASRGVAPPVAVWWPHEESTGRQFLYPQAR